MNLDRWKVAGLLFSSGLCALIYQTVWLREFRLIFGASTLATGAVLAIFMAGLGIGSAVLGKRADARERPLAFYAALEMAIAISAALSPFLLWVAAKVYVGLGGSVAMGTVGATVVRLLLSAIVLAVPTVLMGGTLPAAARAVATSDDTGRRAVALLYGINTLGAVAGTLLSTFFLLEQFGNRKTILLAALVNVLVAVVARSMSRGVSSATAVEKPAPEAGVAPPVPRQVVYAAAALVGFAFLLMELVWYRMLSPLLGGTTYMFGLILAIALAGIGLGGTAYALLRRGPATAGGFAVTCSLEALAMAIPFALGDWLAIGTNILRQLGVTGFSGHLVSWTLITGIVVFPAAFISGIQFPLLISLLGRGRENVGREIGAAYAWNTAGAIAGSLAGGFGLLPLLTAPGCWRAVSVILALLGLFGGVFALRERRLIYVMTTGVAAFLAFLAAAATGPTAVWRHSGIGHGRATTPVSRNALRAWMHGERMTLVWDADGRESSVAITSVNDLAFLVNGKNDGSARGDAGTQVMSGLIGAVLHPNPKTTLVVGLGTGSTSGWLARVPSMERVDTVELEPEVLDVARACAAVNGGAMQNPKVHVDVADAREVLLSTKSRYDLVVSEPSNPYRAGIASLFTSEYYEAVANRLNRGGMLLQWMQMYGIHSDTARTIYATVTRVFPHVQTWGTATGDAILVASHEPIVFDAAAIRARLAEEPFRTAMHRAWRVETAEGFLAHLVANEEFSRRAAEQAVDLNTDDRPVIEFGFARSIGEKSNPLEHLVSTASRLGLDRPTHVRGAFDWDAVARNKPALRRMPFSGRPANTYDLARGARELADRGDENAARVLDVLRRIQPIEADAVLARLHFRKGRPAEAAEALVRAFEGYRRDPWPLQSIMSDAIDTALLVARADRRLAPRLEAALSQRFAVLQQDKYRRYARAVLGFQGRGCEGGTLAALRDMEPHPVWSEDILTMRALCYDAAGDARASEAVDDLAEFKAAEPSPIIPR